MFFLKVIRWHKIGKIRDSATFHEGELRKENGKKKVFLKVGNVDLIEVKRKELKVREIRPQKML